MATVNFNVYKHHKKADGTWNVKLTVYHKRERVYPDTAHYVTEKQLTKKYEIKDKDLIITLTKELGVYREKIGNLGTELHSMSAHDLATYLMSPPVNYEKIDLISFGKELEQVYREDDQRSSANGIRMVINNLIDFQKSDIIYTRDITVDFLKGFEKYLKKPHDQVRTHGSNVDMLTKRPGLKESSIATQFFIFKLIFNAIRNKYYDQQTGEYKIPNYPFRLFKISTPLPSEEEKKELPIPFIRMVRDCKTKPGSIAELARDMDMLSFYLCGINAKDIYNLNEIKGGRIFYNRSKTKSKRKDNAFISIKVVPEAELLLDKYLVKIRSRFKDVHNLGKSISNGNIALKTLICEQYPNSEYLSYDPLFGIFRHAFADEAHNTLGYTIAQVGEALNHGSKTITHRYVKKKWTLIDEMQERVIALLKD